MASSIGGWTIRTITEGRSRIVTATQAGKTVYFDGVTGQWHFNKPPGANNDPTNPHYSAPTENELRAVIRLSPGDVTDYENRRAADRRNSELSLTGDRRPTGGTPSGGTPSGGTPSGGTKTITYGFGFNDNGDPIVNNDWFTVGDSQDARVRDPLFQGWATMYFRTMGRPGEINDNTIAAIENFKTNALKKRAEKKAELARKEDRALTQNYQDRIIAQQEKTLAAQTQYNRDQLAFAKDQELATRKYRESQLAFQKSEAQKEAEHRAKVLARDAKQREEDLAYRQSLLDREDKQRAADLAERKRVEAERNAQWEKQHTLDKKQHKQTLAFQKKTSRQERKLRLKAEAQAEAGTRQKVLASLGFTGEVDRGKISNPVEQLLIRAGRQRRRR